MDCLSEDQKAEFDAIMAQFKIVKRRERISSNAT